MYHFDNYGWLSAAAIPGRSTDIAPGEVPFERVVGEPWPNFTGEEWVMLEYVEPVSLVEPEAPEPEWAWMLDIAPFADRFGVKRYAVEQSTDPFVVSFQRDVDMRRKWIDLKDPRVAAALYYLAGQPIPGIGTIAAPILTVEEVQTILTTPVAPMENLALRKLYFS